MASNKYYMTAGLQVAKASGQSPSVQKNTYYMTAGLPKIVEAAVGGGPFPHHIRRRLTGGMLPQEAA